jgi:hypothetical protein
VGNVNDSVGVPGEAIDPAVKPPMLSEVSNIPLLLKSIHACTAKEE